jgi:Protein of unknown function (DUF3489)
MANAINKGGTFTIDDQNHIANHSAGSEPAQGLTHFRSQQELEAVAAVWPTSKLVDVWNRIPGAQPVQKFTSRSTAIRRIWALLERTTCPERTRAATKPKVDKSKRKAPPVPGAPTTKSATVLALLRQPGGATLKVLMAATGWQAHSVRGFISGQLTKKLRLKVRSGKRDGERVYSIRA